MLASFLALTNKAPVSIDLQRGSLVIEAAVIFMLKWRRECGKMRLR